MNETPNASAVTVRARAKSKNDPSARSVFMSRATRRRLLLKPSYAQASRSRYAQASSSTTGDVNAEHGRGSGNVRIDRAGFDE
jgi:hypothetical protein